MKRLSSLPELPISCELPAILAALETHGRVVIEAPPGAGKTTLVPLALLDAPWLGERKILLLEPRRMAARAAARRMASLLGEPVGATVGFRIRGEQKTGPATIIEVITEGVLTRMLQSDPALEGVGALLFDEFHERSLLSDLALALAWESREALREDLRIALMSATLDGEAAAALLDGAPRITSEGRNYPVGLTYLGRPGDRDLEAATARAVGRALAEQEGDVLVFLPGEGEIRRTMERILPRPGVKISPLYGRLPSKEQDAVLAPAGEGERRVVLATAVAETSLTIPGIRSVVDAGLDRVPVYHPGRGLSRLDTVYVSKASAHQRTGRAGRTAPGHAYRLWGEAEHRGLPAAREAEIRQADLAPLALELACWGCGDPGELKWLDPPPAGAYREACRLLFSLDALDDRGRITLRGRKMAALPVHPRLAHMLLQGADEGMGATALLLAPLLEERDFLPSGAGADISLRLSRLSSGDPAGGAVKRIRTQAQQLEKLLSSQGLSVAGSPRSHEIGRLLALAYPDRIARRSDRGEGRYDLAGGQQAELFREDPLIHQEYLVVAALGGRGAVPRIFLAAPYGRELLEDQFARQITEEVEVSYRKDTGKVTGRSRLRFGSLILGVKILPKPTPALRHRAYLEALDREGLDLLPWNDKSRRLLARMRYLSSPGVRTALPEACRPWPELEDAVLLADAESWLKPWLSSDGPPTDLAGALLGLLAYPQQQLLDRWAPEKITVPAGARHAVDYTRDPPVLRVRIQEVFGLKSHPSLGEGRFPLNIHLLSPAQRPLQVTGDLPGFWEGAYVEVRKEMRGRYPKHYWPENPAEAAATTRTGKNRPGE